MSLLNECQHYSFNIYEIYSKCMLYKPSLLLLLHKFSFPKC